ncbi:MAG: efflux RND transporter periplasmic adaptor subunit [Verrucomicrobia bacterium]|nr:efflux RND transporter periplasmic adaptor subunit [Verrucomicrobiota bacterium]
MNHAHRGGLQFCHVHAPYDGLIIRRDRGPGEMVVPGASLMRMISLDELWVSAWVDETAMPARAADQPARIVFRSEPGHESGAHPRGHAAGGERGR